MKWFSVLDLPQNNMGWEWNGGIDETRLAMSWPLLKWVIGTWGFIILYFSISLNFYIKKKPCSFKAINWLTGFITDFWWAHWYDVNWRESLRAGDVDLRRQRMTPWMLIHLPQNFQILMVLLRKESKYWRRSWRKRLEWLAYGRETTHTNLESPQLSVTILTCSPAFSPALEDS